MPSVIAIMKTLFTKPCWLNYTSIVATPTVSGYVSRPLYVCRNLLNSVGDQMKSCWKEWTRNTWLINCIKFRSRNSPFGLPPFDEKFIEMQVIFCFHKPAPVFGGPKFWDILCWNYIHWSSHFPNTISHYLLVVFVVTLCWGPLLNVQFQPGNWRMRPFCVMRRPIIFQIWLYHTPLTMLLTC